MVGINVLSSLGLDVHGKLADGIVIDPSFGRHVTASNLVAVASDIDPKHCQNNAQDTWRGYATEGGPLRPQREFNAVHEMVAGANESFRRNLNDVQRILVDRARERDPFIRQVESDGKVFCQEQNFRYRPLHERTVYELTDEAKAEKYKPRPVCASSIENEIQAVLARAVNSVLSGNRMMSMPPGLMRHLMSDTLQAANAFRQQVSHAHSHIGEAQIPTGEIMKLKQHFEHSIHAIVDTYKVRVAKLPVANCQEDDDEEKGQQPRDHAAHCQHQR